MFNEIDDICSLELETMEDSISDNFCQCGHLTNEHFVGEISNSSKCFALIFNGTVWSSCKCTKLHIKLFEIIIRIDENAKDFPKNQLAAS